MRRRELVRLRPHAELAGARAGRTVRGLDRRASEPDADELDVVDRRQAPARGRQQVPQHRADEIDLDIAQPARVRPFDDVGRIRRGEQRDEHAIRDHRPRRRQMAVHAHRAGERTKMCTSADEVDAER